MTDNYTLSKHILDGLSNSQLYKESQLSKASALATLALVDEMRAAREPQIEDVFILRQYHPATNTEGLILDVYKDLKFAYGERDRMNATAESLDAPIRYIITEKRVK